MKARCLKSVSIGGLAGLADGLAFAFAYNGPFDFLVPFLLPFAYPCFYVVQRFNPGPYTPEWVAWTAGVLTMVLIGAVLGLGIYWLRRQLTCLLLFLSSLPLV